MPGLPDVVVARLSDVVVARVTDVVGVVVATAPVDVVVKPADVVAELLEHVRARFTPAARERGVALRIAPCDPLRLYGNPEQIERIVANLVDNAIKYTAPGGSVAVACSVDDARVRVAVRDSGVGIAVDHRERIFDRFWRGDSLRNAAGGTGLGLAIARALARRHGGDIAVTSEPGRGSEFTVTLPRRPPALS